MRQNRFGHAGEARHPGLTYVDALREGIVWLGRRRVDLDGIGAVGHSLPTLDRQRNARERGTLQDLAAAHGLQDPLRPYGGLPAGSTIHSPGASSTPAISSDPSRIAGPALSPGR